MCTRAVSTLAHAFDAAGIATVALALNIHQVQAVKPPRALYVEFPLGRPLGRPRDPAFQRSVIDAAFALLDRTDWPVLETFPEVIDDEADEPVACPLPPRVDPSVHPAIDEARGLQPAWARAVERYGSTQVGRAVTAPQVPDALAPFIAVANGTPWSEADFPGDPTTVLMDIRAYYEEAALGLSEHVPAARSAETWLFQRTETGRVLRAFFEAVRASDPPFPGIYYVMPYSQQDDPSL